MTREQERRILVAAMAAAARMRDAEDGGVSREHWDPESRALFEAVFDLEPAASQIRRRQ